MIVYKNYTKKIAYNYLIDSGVKGCFIVYYFEARYYRAPTFTSRDPLFEKYFWMSPYAYCANNPVKYVDPTGEFPVWALVGAGIDYASQVYNNYKKGQSGYNAWVGNVNFVSVGLSAVNPVGKLKVAKTVAVEVTKAAIEYTPNEKLKVTTDIKEVATKAAVSTAVDVGAGKLIDASSTKALQNVNKEVSIANKQLNTAERQAQRSPNSTQKADNVINAQSNLETARNKQVGTQILNSTIGKAPNATQQAARTASGRIVQNNENDK